LIGCDLEVADGQRLVGGRVETTYPCPDAGDQLLGLERLHDVVVGTRLEAENHVDRVALGGEHHDRNPGLGADLLADVDAVLAGQHQVEEHHVGTELPEEAQRLVAARAHAALEALLPEDDREHLRQGRVVVHDEHAAVGGDLGWLGHASSLPAERAETGRWKVSSGIALA
jgi:hypothetical protein